MFITSISVTYSETHSLPEYCNVRPSVTLTAELEKDDSPPAIRKLLMDNARTAVRAEIDAALEADGQPPKYYTGPRFKVLFERESKTVVVMPNSEKNPDGYDWCYVEGQTCRRHRLEICIDMAKIFLKQRGENYQDEYTISGYKNGALCDLKELDPVIPF